MRHFKILLLPFLFSFYLVNAQNANSEASDLRISKALEKESPNCLFLDGNKTYSLPAEGGFVYSSFNNANELTIGGYENNEDYTVTIKNEYDRKIILKLQFFNTEKDVDVLNIYDGKTADSPLISSLSGIIDNELRIVSKGNYITLRFKSNNRNTYKGFRFRADNGSSVYKTSGGGDLPTPQACSGTPASDECNAAPLICNLNGYCGNTSSAYTAGNTSVLSNWCGSASIENNSWIKFIASSSSASLSIVSGGCQSSSSGIQAAMFASSDCSNFTKVSNCVNQSSGSGAFTISNNVSLVVGQTYYIMIDGYAGNVCSYTVTAQNGVSTSATQIVASQSQVCPGFSTSLASAVNASSSNSYTWTSTPAGSYPNTQTITVSPSATTVYTLTMGASPCSSVVSVAVKTIQVTSTLNPANITAPTTACNGSPVNLTSLTNGGTYAWAGPAGFTASTQNATIPNWSSANNGSYSLTINYGAGCATTPTFVTITGVNPPTVTLVSSSPTVCSGSSFTLTAGGGSGNNPYSWDWNVLETSIILQSCLPFVGCTDNPLFSLIPQTASTGPKAVITPNTSTEICASTTSSNGCSATSCFSISVITCSVTSCSSLTLAVSSQSNVNCFGANTGSATVSATGGNGTYTYTWMPGNLTGATQSNLSAGTYTVMGKDGANCTGSITIVITQPTAPISLSLVGITPAACGSANGSATVSATGGTPVYNYTWFPTGGSSTTASALNAGTYTVGVVDSKGCFTITTIAINSAGGPTVSVTSFSNINCFGANNGMATVTSTGGTGNYTWTPGNLSGASQNALNPGLYTISTADNSGCIGSTTVAITQPTSALTATISSTGTSCGGSTGSATVTTSGGTPTYNYAWLPSGGSSATASNLVAGNYSVTVTDAKSCTVIASTNITSTGSATIAIATQSNVTCFGDNDGSASVVVSGVATYTWLPTGGNANSASNLQAGTYTVAATVSGCLTFTTVTITSPLAINISVNTTSASCTAADGSAVAIASGGSGTYTYTWSDATNGTTLSNVLGGTYTVEATDVNGCTGFAVATIGINTGGFTVNAGTGTTIEFGQSTTLNGIVPTGATYTWTPAGTLSCYNCLTPIATPTQSIIYTLNATDANGCVAKDTVIIMVNIPCGEMFVPTAFSPNNDGANDELYVYGNCITSLEFAIFDRWGEKVFETNDKAIGWDGKYKGKDMNAASFAYYVTATVNGIIITKKGAIALVR